MFGDKLPLEYFKVNRDDLVVSKTLQQYVNNLIPLTTGDMGRLQAFLSSAVIAVCDADPVVLRENVDKVAQTGTDVALELFPSADEGSHEIFCRSVIQRCEIKIANRHLSAPYQSKD
jgi:hypothetical protein